MQDVPDTRARQQGFRWAIACAIVLISILYSDGALCGWRQKVGGADERLWYWIGDWNEFFVLLSLLAVLFLAVLWRRSRYNNAMPPACKGVLLLQSLLGIIWLAMYWLGLSKVPSEISTVRLLVGALPVPFVIVSLLVERGAYRFAMSAAIAGAMCLGLLFGHQVLHVSWCPRHTLTQVVYSLSAVGLVGVFLIILKGSITNRSTERSSRPGGGLPVSQL